MTHDTLWRQLHVLVTGEDGVRPPTTRTARRRCQWRRGPREAQDALYISRLQKILSCLLLSFSINANFEVLRGNTCWGVFVRPPFEAASLVVAACHHEDEREATKSSSRSARAPYTRWGRGKKRQETYFAFTQTRTTHLVVHHVQRRQRVGRITTCPASLSRLGLCCHRV